MKTNWTKTHKILTLLFAIFIALSFSSCSFAFEVMDELLFAEVVYSNYDDYYDEDYDDSDLPQGGCPAHLAATAFEYAKKYAAADTQYVYGAQDPLRSIRVDCSGLVIRCYGYALQNTGYRLMQSDMSSSYMYQYASIHTSSPRHGDLIFMGEENSSSITHIGIFDRFEGDQVYFIDATNRGRTDGVSERHYSRTSRKIKGYGIMKVKR